MNFISKYLSFVQNYTLFNKFLIYQVIDIIKKIHFNLNILIKLNLNYFFHMWLSTLLLKY